MDYLALFSPILAHGVRANLVEAAGKYGVSEARAILTDIDSLIVEAFRNRRPANARVFDQAWFPVRAWLDEKLDGLRHRAGRNPDPRTRGFASLAHTGEEFLRRIDALLDAEGSRSDIRERMDVVEIYLACLNLDYRGGRDVPPEGRENRRRRCLETLAASETRRDKGVVRPDPSKGRGPGRESRSMFPFWAIPTATTFGLFLLYRLLLTDLFAAFCA